jgi:hypothetical protein
VLADSMPNNMDRVGSAFSMGEFWPCPYSMVPSTNLDSPLLDDTTACSCTRKFMGIVEVNHGDCWDCSDVPSFPLPSPFLGLQRN